MPFTFLIFLAVATYLVVLGGSFLVFGPMMLIESKEVMAKKVLFTVLISLPCLIIMGFICGVVFIIPGVMMIGLITLLGEAARITVILTGLAIFGITVAVSSLYLWYILSNVMYQRIDGRSVFEFLDNDSLFQSLRPLFYKLHIFRYYTSDPEAEQ